MSTEQSSAWLAIDHTHSALSGLKVLDLSRVLAGPARCRHSDQAEPVEAANPTASEPNEADIDTILRNLGLLDSDGLGSEATSGDPSHEHPVDGHDARVATMIH